MAYTVKVDGKKAFIIALIIALILKLFFFDFIIAQGHSMEPAIKDGDLLIISNLRYGIRLPRQLPGHKTYIIRWAQPKVGEVVVFYTPDGEIAVKRCTELIDGKSFYAQGDNSLASYDSRTYGFIRMESIIGKVLGR